jgi:hypothetical protein
MAAAVEASAASASPRVSAGRGAALLELERLVAELKSGEAAGKRWRLTPLQRALAVNAPPTRPNELCLQRLAEGEAVEALAHDREVELTPLLARPPPREPSLLRELQEHRDRVLAEFATSPLATAGRFFDAFCIAAELVRFKLCARWARFGERLCAARLR